MAISKYDNPALQPVREFVNEVPELPTQLLYEQGKRYREDIKANKANIEKQKSAIATWTQSLPVDDEKRVKIANEYYDRINQVVEKSNFDYGAIGSEIDKFNIDLQREVTSGALGAFKKSLDTDIANKTAVEEATKKNPDGNLSVIGYNAQLASLENSYSDGTTISKKGEQMNRTRPVTPTNDSSKELTKRLEELSKLFKADKIVFDKSTGNYINVETKEFINYDEASAAMRGITTQEGFKEYFSTLANSKHIEYIAAQNASKNIDYMLSQDISDEDRQRLLQTKNENNARIKILETKNKYLYKETLTGYLTQYEQTLAKYNELLKTSDPAQKKNLQQAITNYNEEIEAIKYNLNNIDKIDNQQIFASLHSEDVQNEMLKFIKPYAEATAFAAENLTKKVDSFALARYKKSLENDPITDIGIASLVTSETRTVNVSAEAINTNTLAQVNAKTKFNDTIEEVYNNLQNGNGVRLPNGTIYKPTKDEISAYMISGKTNNPNLDKLLANTEALNKLTDSYLSLEAANKSVDDYKNAFNVLLTKNNINSKAFEERFIDNASEGIRDTKQTGSIALPVVKQWLNNGSLNANNMTVDRCQSLVDSYNKTMMNKYPTEYAGKLIALDGKEILNAIANGLGGDNQGNITFTEKIVTYKGVGKNDVIKYADRAAADMIKGTFNTQDGNKVSVSSFKDLGYQGVNLQTGYMYFAGTEFDQGDDKTSKRRSKLSLDPSQTTSVKAVYYKAAGQTLVANQIGKNYLSSAGSTAESITKFIDYLRNDPSLINTAFNPFVMMGQTSYGGKLKQNIPINDNVTLVIAGNNYQLVEKSNKKGAKSMAVDENQVACLLGMIEYVNADPNNFRIAGNSPRNEITDEIVTQ
jgi:hypothetical protein